MKKFILIVALALVAAFSGFQAQAQTVDTPTTKWFAIVSSQDNNIVYELNARSVHYETTAKSGLWVIGTVRSKDQTTGTIKFFSVATLAAHCRAGQGVFVVIPVDTAVEPHKADFVFDGGNIASHLAQSICYYDQAAQKNQPQSTPAPSQSLKSPIKEI